MKKTVVVLAIIFFILLNFQNHASSQDEHYSLGLRYSPLLKSTNRGTGWMKVPLHAEGTSELLGVRMYAEKNQYPSDVSKINVSWENETDKELIFGDMFYIQKLDGEEWKTIEVKVTDLSIGYRVAPYSEVKHSYNMRVYSNKLEKGTYRIATDFGIINNTDNKHYYKLTRNFNVITINDPGPIHLE